LLYVESLTYKLKYKLHMLTIARWGWPTVKAETCRSIK